MWGREETCHGWCSQTGLSVHMCICVYVYVCIRVHVHMCLYGCTSMCVRFAHTNPLHADVFPSVARFEAEVVAMTAHMMGGGGGGRCAAT